MIVIVDYGSGNLMGVKNALKRLGVDAIITSKPKDIRQAKRIILPGVGAFGFMMQSLRRMGIEDALKEAIKEGKPFLGICIGLQVLFEKSEESPGIAGMGIFEGSIMKFHKGKVPQIGWNRIIPKDDPLFVEGYAYFVNSYFAIPDDKKIVAATTDYFGEFASAIRDKNVTAVQFHPEKSGEYGLGLLRRWLSC